MHEINPLLDNADKDLQPHSSASRTGAGRTDNRQGGKGAEGQGAGRQRQESDPDHVDAINQLFAEFELAYHNQYQKAYADPDRLMLTKKYWLQVLADFSPAQIVAAARQLVRQQEFMPTLAVVVKACESGLALFGLPDAREAYIEACRAPHPKSAWQWSHPAVYHAGRAADWYLLATAPEDKAFPVFSHYYQRMCRRVMHGEALADPAPPALESNPSRPLSREERRLRMEALRRELDV
jgi:hypothetical protein